MFGQLTSLISGFLRLSVGAISACKICKNKNREKHCTKDWYILFGLYFVKNRHFNHFYCRFGSHLTGFVNQYNNEKHFIELIALVWAECHRFEPQPLFTRNFLSLQFALYTVSYRSLSISISPPQRLMTHEDE